MCHCSASALACPRVPLPRLCAGVQWWRGLTPRRPESGAAISFRPDGVSSSTAAARGRRRPGRLRRRGGRATARSILASFSTQSATLRPGRESVAGDHQFAGAGRRCAVAGQQPPAHVLRQAGRSGRLPANSALLATLLTFCPPGPPLREKVNCSSLSGIRNVSVTTSMLHLRCELRARSGRRRTAVRRPLCQTQVERPA